MTTDSTTKSVAPLNPPPPPRQLTNEEASDYYIWKVEDAIAYAGQGESNLTDFHMAVDGMSSYKGRHFLNNLLDSIVITGRRARYLEVGSWRGSTLCAATFGNDVEAIAIDNFSQFTDFSLSGRDPRHPRDAIMANMRLSRLFSKPAFDAAVLDQDAFTVDPNGLGLFDVYFYDGEHVGEAQYKAFTHFAPALQNVFIAIVDDAKDPATQEATRKAFSDQGWTVTKEWLLYDECDGTDDGRMKDGWWNGMMVAVVIKKP
jgi:hypothetical protein